MFTFLTILFIGLGLFVAASYNFLIGLIVILIGSGFSTLRSPEDEERLMAVLAFLAFLGAAATIIDYVFS